jgi:tetratricopeptide (TPR) repeat protein
MVFRRSRLMCKLQCDKDSELMVTMKIKSLLLTAVCSALLQSTCVYAGNTAYGELEQAISKKQYQQAYQQALRLKVQYEGEPRFDYLYGLAAVQSGHYNEAVFALERVIAADPKLIRPRLELARAYLGMHKGQDALREFRIVKTLNPPPAVQANVDEYIRRISSGDVRGARRSALNSAVSLTFGYSDNINYGHDGDQIDLPVFGNVLLDPSAVKQGSAFAEAKGQINYQHAYSRQINQFVYAALRHRDYFDNGDFNLSELDFRTGFTYNRNQRQYQLVLRGRPLLLGGHSYSNTLGLDLALSSSPAPGSLLTAALTLENYDHKVDSLRDRKRLLLSGKLDKKINNNLHQFSVYVGGEDPKHEGGKPYSRNLAGVGYRLAHSWDTKNKSTFQLNYQLANHQDNYPLYAEKRKDKQAVLRLQHEYRINKKASLVAAAELVDNNSNLALYDTSSNEIQMGVRYEW